MDVLSELGQAVCPLRRIKSSCSAWS